MTGHPVYGRTPFPWLHGFSSFADPDPFHFGLLYPDSNQNETDPQHGFWVKYRVFKIINSSKKKGGGRGKNIKLRRGKGNIKVVKGRNIT